MTPTQLRSQALDLKRSARTLREADFADAVVSFLDAIRPVDLSAQVRDGSLLPPAKKPADCPECARRRKQTAERVKRARKKAAL